MEVISNIGKMLNINSNKISFVKDNRESAKSGFTSKYQIGILISDKKQFNDIQKKLVDFMLSYNDCTKKDNNTLVCNFKKNSEWLTYGFKNGNYTALYPNNFEKKQTYLISHSFTERLIHSPIILRKKQVLTILNQIGNINSVSKTMKVGGRCCKCKGGRGAYGTKCYDDPSFCCKKSKNSKNSKKSKKNIKVKK